jgi:hypothetical protein
VCTSAQLGFGGLGFVKRKHVLVKSLDKEADRDRTMRRHDTRKRYNSLSVGGPRQTPTYDKIFNGAPSFSSGAALASGLAGALNDTRNPNIVQEFFRIIAAVIEIASNDERVPVFGKVSRNGFKLVPSPFPLVPERMPVKRHDNDDASRMRPDPYRGGLPG